MEPCHIGGGGGAHVGEGQGDVSGLISGLGLLLGAVQPDQHNGGLGAGGGPVQLKAVGGAPERAPEHADAGKVLCHGVVLRGGGCDGHGGRQQQGGGQNGENAFHISTPLFLPPAARRGACLHLTMAGGIRQ